LLRIHWVLSLFCFHRVLFLSLSSRVRQIGGGSETIKPPDEVRRGFFGSLAETQTDRVLNPEWRYHHHKHVFIRIGPVTIEKEH
jgi:hypothetical protein